MTAANLSQSYASSDSVLPGPLNRGNFHYYSSGPAPTRASLSLVPGFTVPSQQQSLVQPGPDPASTRASLYSVPGFTVSSQQQSLVQPGQFLELLSNESYSSIGEINQGFYYSPLSFTHRRHEIQPQTPTSTPQDYRSTEVPLQASLGQQRSRSQYSFAFSETGNNFSDIHDNTTTSGGSQESSQSVTFGLPTPDLYTSEDLTWLINDSQSLIPNTAPTQLQPHNLLPISADINGPYHYSQSSNLALPSTPLSTIPVSSTHGTSNFAPNLIPGSAAPVVNLPRARTQPRRAAKRGSHREKESVMTSPDNQLLHKKAMELQWRKFHTCIQSPIS